MTGEQNENEMETTHDNAQNSSILNFGCRILILWIKVIIKIITLIMGHLLLLKCLKFLPGWRKMVSCRKWVECVDEIFVNLDFTVDWSCHESKICMCQLSLAFAVLPVDLRVPTFNDRKLKLRGMRGNQI